MVKYLFIVFILIFGALSAIYFFVGVPNIYEEKISSPQPLHLYNNPEQPIDEIEIYAFYFVPNNKVEVAVKDWHRLLQESLQKLQRFHAFQFRGRSRIAYHIYPDPVIGFQDSLAYDTEVTDRGNPFALLNVAEELETRVFEQNGDLFTVSFTQRPATTYPVMLILYEGVGASGGIVYESESQSVEEVAKELGLPESVVFLVNIESVDGFVLLNREFLEGLHGPFGDTLLAHEFYHTLGLPDAYELSTGVAFSEDMMGSGRFKPIEKVYISRDILSNLGI